MENAEAAFRVASRLDPENSRAYTGQAMIFQARNDPARAFEMYLYSLELNSDDLTALLGLFQVSCRMKSFAKVIYYLDLYLDMHPGDISVMFCLATLHMKDGRDLKARKILQDILILDPKNEDAANLLEEVDNVLAQTTR